MSSTVDDDRHPLFVDGLPDDFRSNAVLAALSSTACDGLDDNDTRAVAVDLPPPPPPPARGGRYRDHLRAKAAAHAARRAPHGGRQLEPPATTATAAAGAPRAAAGVVDRHDAELSLLMGLWRPTAAAQSQPPEPRAAGSGAAGAAPPT